jgi:ribosomal protein S18 acetylase RimI-like enzyme
MSAVVKPYSEEMLSDLRDIFFETSSIKVFKDEASKEIFFTKYLGFYLEHFPHLCFVVEREKRILGYVVGATESLSVALLSLQPHLEVFRDAILQYPAHLHINFHADAQGHGFGRNLISHLESVLKTHDIHGLHIMTGPNAPNRFFYQKLGFTFEIVKEFQTSSILFMGKTI